MIYVFFNIRLVKVHRSLLHTVAVPLLVFLALSGLSSAPGFSANADAVIDRSPIGDYLAGRHAQAENDFDAAIEFLSATLHVLPDVPDLLRRTFILMVIEGRLDEAVPYAKRLLKNQPNEPIAHLVTLVAAFKNGDEVEQTVRLKAQPNTGLNGFSKPVFEAWGKVGAGDINTALKLLGALDGKDAAQNIYNMHKALILDAGGRQEDAELAYMKLASSQKTLNFRVTQLLGNFLERTGKKSEAAVLYDKFAKANPETMLLVPAYARLRSDTKPEPIIITPIDGTAEALFNIANSLGEQRARETAVVFCRLALWLKPGFPMAQMMMAELLDDNQRYAKANEIYSNIHSGSPLRFSADLRRASNLNSLKDLDAAITLLKGMSKKFALMPQPLVRLGNLMRRHERWDEAITAYTQAIDRVGTLTKRHWRMLYSRGIVLERAKRWPEAEKDFLRALEFEPDQPYVLNYLGYSWVDQGLHLKKALDMIHTAVRRHPNDGYIIDSLGWVYYRLGNYKKAVSELERAVQMRPDDPIINDHLGDAYWKVGRELEAQFQWKRALSFKPEPEVEANIIKKLEEGLVPNEHIGTPNDGSDKFKAPKKI